MDDKLLSQCTDEEIFQVFCERVKNFDDRTIVSATPQTDGMDIDLCSIWGPASASMECSFSAEGNLKSVSTY